MDKPVKVFIFLDTNVFMHFPRIDNVDWRKAFDQAEVEIVVDQLVLKELNNHKDGGKGEARRNKARTTLAYLKNFLENGDRPSVRDGVAVAAHLDAISVNMEDLQLDHRNQDDRLIAGILSYKQQHLGDKVFIVADDLGVRLKAKKFDIPAIDPTSFSIREELQLDEEKELHQLKARAARLENSIPDMTFGIADGGSILGIAKVRIIAEVQTLPSDEHIHYLIKNKENFLLNGVSTSFGVTQGDVNNYVKKVHDYMKLYAGFLEKESIFNNSLQVNLSFGLSCSKSSSEHVAITASFQEAILVKYACDREDYLLKNLTPPLPPKKPVAFPSSLSSYGPYVFPNNFPSIAMPSNANVESFGISDKIVTWKIPVVRNGEEIVSEGIWLVLPNSIGRGFQIPYSTMSSKTEKKDSVLNVQIER